MVVISVKSEEVVVSASVYLTKKFQELKIVIIQVIIFGKYFALDSIL